MSPFREALKAAGHGEWVIEMISASGEVRLRKINERTGAPTRLTTAPTHHNRTTPLESATVSAISRFQSSFSPSPFDSAESALLTGVAG
jgi:hypothetical protein